MKRPKCPLCGRDYQTGLLFLLCRVQGFEKSVFVCGECYMKDKRVINRIRAT